MIKASIEIARKPEDVFAYVADLDRHHEWQDAIVSARHEPPGPTRVGTRNIETRRVPGPGGPREFISEIVECEAPRRLAFRGLNGPLRPQGAITIEPSGAGSRYTMEFDLIGHGFGKLLAPLALRGARKQIPIDQQRLKQRLESGS